MLTHPDCILGQKYGLKSCGVFQPLVKKIYYYWNYTETDFLKHHQSTSQKLDFANNVQLSLTLAALSLGLWWTFDRSRSGFGLGLTTAFLATLIAQLLVYNGIYQYTSPDFLYVRSWLPCIFFSGGVTVGNIGRQLAMGSTEKPHND
ncbi:insulin-induced gene 1 protein-like [Sinocyclocheilus rhinocerous]|uniref:insulin-induced gene 1 protein-like n=1 Tax=Sinocyclocheilus rhinocerous TaxID=307959 RepID=UPI0007BA3F88|nr:PREDICTED: insulin-induced gene 1 protein-like [Sinocyclocheilus rhinocerous]